MEIRRNYQYVPRSAVGAHNKTGKLSRININWTSSGLSWRIQTEAKDLTVLEWPARCQPRTITSSISSCTLSVSK